MATGSINWTGKKGNQIELRAECNITLDDRRVDLDGDVITLGQGTKTRANLELWVDSVKMDSSWDINFWQLIDIPGHPELKKVWGLKLAVDLERAAKVEEFLKSVIEAGKSDEVKAYDQSKREHRDMEMLQDAKRTVARAEHTRRNNDGSLMTRAQAKAWRTNYNNIVNEGGEGYIPEIITAEDVAWAEQVLSGGCGNGKVSN